MATTYYSPSCRSGAGIQPRTPLGICSVSGSFDIAATGQGGGVAFIINDVVQMVKIPSGATVLDIILDCPDLDTSTGVRLSVGDGSSSARYIASNNVGVAGGIIRLSVTGSSQYAYTADDTIDILVAAAATGTAATTGVIYMTVFYSMDA